MRTEYIFISECLKSFLGNNSDSLRRLYSRVDHNKLNYYILERNLGGFFYYLYGNQTFKTLEIPSRIIQIWKEIAGRNSINNALKDQEALDIINNLENNKLDYVYIKGFSIRRQCYSCDYIKGSSDIDLMIKKNDYQKIKELLLAKGYQIPYSHYINDFGVKIPFQEYEDHTYEISFVKKQGTVKYIIDLQWDFIFSDSTNFFHRLYELDSFYKLDSINIIEYQKNRIKVFAKEIELINIAFHYAFGHGFKGMSWLIDLCAYIKTNKEVIDFNYIVKSANPNLRKIIGLILMIAHDYNGWGKLSRKQAKEFCLDKLLPLEYRLYRRMHFRNLSNSLSNKLYLRMVRILLPYRLIDRLRALKYFFFNLDSIKQKLNPEMKVNKGLLPFYIIKILISDIIKGKR